MHGSKGNVFFGGLATNVGENIIFKIFIDNVDRWR
jgi:hypothetical protein